MGLFLDSQFYSIDLYIYPYANTTQSDYCSFIVSFEMRKCESSILATLGPIHFMNVSE